MSASPSPTAEPSIQRVSNVELFFDLVFVFTLTQLTGLVAHPHDLSDYLKAILVFMTLMWIYDGFTWLTSNLSIDKAQQRKLLFIAMAGFFIMALSIPEVFGEGGLPYALGFLTVVAVHAALFRAAPTATTQAVRNIASFNFTVGLLVLAAAFVSPPWDWLLWVAAAAVLFLAASRRAERNFQFSPAHFVERHGLLMIVALGESIVAVGVGAQGLPLTLMVILTAILALLLSASIWWSYFAKDAERAEHQLVHATPAERNRMGAQGFGYAHFIMILGIILIAAGLEVAIAHPTGHPEAVGIWNLAVGLAVYLAGDAMYRQALRLGPSSLHLLLAVLMFVTVPVGLFFGALAQIVACVLLLQLLWMVKLEP
ncbi:MAG: low temperature requirement protein A [Ardenticatenales bacterium]|nr:low temperature requirement protein A [Ardenticatenales bacterium]